MTSANGFIQRQLASTGWAPLNHEMATLLDPGTANEWPTFLAWNNTPGVLPRTFPRTSLYQAQVADFGEVLLLVRSPIFLVERLQFLGFEASGVERLDSNRPPAQMTSVARQPETTGDAIARRYAAVVTKEPPRPCKSCRQLSSCQTCMAAARGEIEGAPDDYRPDLSWPRRCLSYVPPSPERDEILGRDGRRGPELWPEVAALEAAAPLAKALAGETETAAARARDLLVSMLSQGPRDAAEILSAAEGDMIGERTMQRAAEALGVVKTRAGFRGGWTWALPLAEVA